MIKLELEPYCENCSEFEANVDKSRLWEGNKVFCNVTVITCEFATRCELIKHHLQSKEVGEE